MLRNSNGARSTAGTGPPRHYTGRKQEEDEEEEQTGDWPGVVRNGTFRWQVLTASLGSGCGFKSFLILIQNVPSPLQLCQSNLTIIYSPRENFAPIWNESPQHEAKNFGFFFPERSLKLTQVNDQFDPLSGPKLTDSQ